MVISIERNDIWGRIGKNFGEGAGQALSKQIGHNRVSNAIEDIEKNPGTPLQNYTRLIRSGASENQINQVSPYIRNTQLATQKNNMGQVSPNQTTQQPAAGQAQPNQTMQLQGKGQPQGQAPRATTSQAQGEPTVSIKSPKAQKAALTALTEAHPQQIDDRARQLMAEDPVRFQGPSAYGDALGVAERELNYPYRQQKEQIEALARQAGIEQSLSNKFVSKIQNKSIDLANVTQEVAQRSQKKAEARFLNGESEEEATEEETKLLKHMNDNIVTLNNSIGSRPFFGAPSEQLIKDINKLRKPFADAGELDLFKNKIMQATDNGPKTASMIAFPPTQEQVKIIQENAKEEPKKIAAKLSKKIDKNTSLETIGYLASKAGIDDKALIDAIVDLQVNGIINFENRQDREAAEYTPSNQSLTMGDFLFENFFGFGAGTALRGLSEYLGFTKNKVGPVEKIKRHFGKE